MTQLSQAYKDSVVKKLETGEPIKFESIYPLQQAEYIFNKHPLRKKLTGRLTRANNQPLTLVYRADLKKLNRVRPMGITKKPQTPVIKTPDALQAAVELLNQEVIRSMGQGILPEFDFSDFRVKIKRLWKAQ